MAEKIHSTVLLSLCQNLFTSSKHVKETENKWRKNKNLIVLHLSNIKGREASYLECIQRGTSNGQRGPSKCIKHPIKLKGKQSELSSTHLVTAVTWITRLGARTLPTEDLFNKTSPLTRRLPLNRRDVSRHPFTSTQVLPVHTPIWDKIRDENRRKWINVLTVSYRYRQAIGRREGENVNEYKQI